MSMSRGHAEAKQQVREHSGHQCCRGHHTLRFVALAFSCPLTEAKLIFQRNACRLIRALVCRDALFSPGSTGGPLASPPPRHSPGSGTGSRHVNGKIGGAAYSLQPRSWCSAKKYAQVQAICVCCPESRVGSQRFYTWRTKGLMIPSCHCRWRTLLTIIALGSLWWGGVYVWQSRREGGGSNGQFMASRVKTSFDFPDSTLLYLVR